MRKIMKILVVALSLFVVSAFSLSVFADAVLNDDTKIIMDFTKGEVAGWGTFEGDTFTQTTIAPDATYGITNGELTYNGELPDMYKVKLTYKTNVETASSEPKYGQCYRIYLGDNLFLNLGFGNEPVQTPAWGYGNESGLNKTGAFPNIGWVKTLSVEITVDKINKTLCVKYAGISNQNAALGANIGPFYLNVDDIKSGGSLDGRLSVYAANNGWGGVTCVELTTSEIFPLGIMPEFPSFGAYTNDGIKLNFTAPVEKTALEGALSLANGTISNVTMSNDDKSALITIADSEAENTLTVAGTLVGKRGEWMGDDPEANAKPNFVYSFRVNNLTEGANALKTHDITSFLTSASGEIKLYDEKRFDNEVYYAGDVTLASDSYIYFGSKKTDNGIEGYRVKIVPGAASKVVMEKFDDNSNITTIATSTLQNGFKVGDTVKFGIEITNEGTSADVFVIGKSAFANISKENLTLPGGYVGAGCESGQSEFANMKVLATGANEFASLQILEKSPIFEAYSIYKSTDVIDVMVKVNVIPENLQGTPVYRIDNGEWIELPQIEAGDGYTLYKATVSGLSKGNHTISAKFIDKLGDPQEFTSETIVISEDKTIAPVGFFDDTTAAATLEEVKGKPLTVKFYVDFAGEYNIFVVLRSTANGKVAMKKQPFAALTAPGEQTATLEIPNQDLTGCTVKAFVVNAESGAPISGYIELK